MVGPLSTSVNGSAIGASSIAVSHPTPASGVGGSARHTRPQSMSKRVACGERPARAARGLCERVMPRAARQPVGTQAGPPRQGRCKREMLCPVGRTRISSAGDEWLLAALRRGDEAAFAELVECRHLPCCVWHTSTCATARWPRRWCRRPGWACCAASTASRDARRSRPRSQDPHRRRHHEGRSRAAHAALLGPRGCRGGRRNPGGRAGALPRCRPRCGRTTGPGPTRWQTPEEHLLTGETRKRLLEAVRQLPPAQRTVITLRDIEGWPSDEVCDALMCPRQPARAPAPRPQQGAYRPRVLLGRGRGDRRVTPAAQGRTTRECPTSATC